MNEENLYNDIPARYKDCVGFPTSYCHLTLEQKFFVDSIFYAKIETERETIVADIECLRDDLEDALAIAKNTLVELRGN